eukprot:TRINITY_DN6702_c0_g10_i1.p2 TRINITY_DN6702_c0_g10~~TRINITY_DN6702_c0_g10_i1.p2  ORF type:complete len:176 (+),score=62.69 TRINITY_DN6702_c0_g10_i1:81-608(+)
MFFTVTLNHNVHVDPINFHNEINTIVRYQLCKEVEGTIDEEHGYIVAVDTSEQGMQVGPGVLLDTGPASFHVKYRALVLRPFEDESIDALISKVTQMGVFANVGPLEVFVSKENMPDSYKYDDSNPMQPKFVAGTDDSLMDGDLIRLVMRGVRITNTKIEIIGDITASFMGKISA